MGDKAVDKSESIVEAVIDAGTERIRRKPLEEQQRIVSAPLKEYEDTILQEGSKELQKKERAEYGNIVPGGAAAAAQSMSDKAGGGRETSDVRSYREVVEEGLYYTGQGVQADKLDATVEAAIDAGADRIMRKPLDKQAEISSSSLAEFEQKVLEEGSKELQKREQELYGRTIPGGIAHQAQSMAGKAARGMETPELSAFRDRVEEKLLNNMR